MPVDFRLLNFFLWHFICICLQNHMTVDFAFFILPKFPLTPHKGVFVRHAGKYILTVSLSTTSTNITNMPSYTPQQVRDFIDDLDAVLRRAVVEKKLKAVFEEEKKRIVSQ